ncbi:MAG: ABC transporter permease [Anaerovibrio sp.]|nr:ABC transporter permease [Anaerovibrio sp.]
MIAAVITILLTWFLSNNIMKDAGITVIDLDNSRYSRELIQKIDTSVYMKVENVVYTPGSPEKFFFMERSVAAICLPKGLEKDRYSNTSTSIGALYDNINAASTGEIKAALNEIIAMENEQGGGHISLNERLLFNPVGSSSSGEVLNFLFFFSSMFFAFATLGIVPRLRMENKLELILAEGNPLDILLRLVPYWGCLLTALSIGLTILRFVGDLVINGNLLLFLFSQILYVFVLGVCCVIMGWNAGHPSLASSRMILFVPLGFILGAAVPMPLLADWVRVGAHLFPLTWEFNFVRDILLRGASFWDIGKLFGLFLVYIGSVLGLYGLIFRHACKNIDLQKLCVARRNAREMIQS